MINVLNQLREKGYRLTEPRKQILDSLNFHPQSVSDIIASLKKMHAHVDMATVYRTLEVLVELGIVGKTKFGDKAMFELLSNDHHHHLICNDCGSIEDIPLDEKFLMNQVDKQTKFKVQSHSLEFFGLCKSCQ